MAGYNFSNSGGAGFTFSAGQGGYNFSAPQSGRAMPGFLEKIGGFARSAVESFPELLGIEPSEAVQTYRAQNPVGGITSQIVGAFVPYLGAAKAARAAPLTGRFIAAAEGLGSGPISKAALGAGAEAAVVEAGRVGLAATGLPEQIYEGVTGRETETRGLGQIAGEGLINVGAGVVLGGALGGLAARFAKGPRIEDLVPQAAADQPLALQARSLNETLTQALDETSAVQLDEATFARLSAERDRRIRWNLEDAEPVYTDTGETARSGKYRQDLGKSYRKLVGDKKDTISGFLNRANNWKTQSPDKLTATRRMLYEPTERGGYQSAEQLEQDIRRIMGDQTSDLQELRNTLGLYAQDIKTIQVKQGSGKQVGKAPEEIIPAEGGDFGGKRLLTQPQEFNTTRDPLLGRARGLQRRFQGKAFADVGDGWRLAKEEDGLYVMAKKLEGGPDAAPGDKWAFFRTDRPDVFAPKAARSNDAFMRSAYLPKPEERLVIGDPVFDEVSRFMKDTENVPLRKTTPAKNALAASARESLETVGTYAAPTVHLGTRNPLLNRGLTLLKHAERIVKERVDNVLYGERKLVPGKSIGRQVLEIAEPESNGLFAREGELGLKDRADIKFVIENEMPFDQVLAANARRDVNGDPVISDKARDFLRALNMIDESFVRRVENLQQHLTSEQAMHLVAEFQARKGHYTITREYPGAYRYLLEEGPGNVVGVASGKSPLEAQQEADKLVQEFAKRGRTLTVGGMFDEAMRSPEQIEKVRAAYARPGFIKNRGNILGFELQRGDLTSNDLRELIEKNLRRRENYIRNVSLIENLQDTLAQLERTRPQDALVLKKRLHLLAAPAGQHPEGPLAQTVNNMADKALHAIGFSGKDSASGIVRATQEVLGHFTFGFTNLTQPILNIVGTLQTMLPEISFIMHGSEKLLGQHYVTLPMVGRNGNLAGSMGMLSEIKIFKRAIEHMFTPPEKLAPAHREMIEKLIAQGELAPQFIEENFGSNGHILRDPTNIWRDSRSFIRYFKAANYILMSKSEELNRMMVMNAAYEIGTLMELPADRLARFASELLARTSYNYTTLDRASIFTTPVGSLLGTFKNWMFHYMGTMIKYASGGKEALPALLWQTAATAAIGGGAATPLLMPIADGASKFLADKNFMEFLYSQTGGDGLDERVADGLLYGVPGALGLSFASQTAAPGSDPVRDASMIFNFAAFDRMKGLSNATKDALIAAKVSGENPWNDENVRMELTRALAPRTFYRAMAVAETTAVRSMATGYDVSQPLGVGGALLYTLGFNPTELDKTYDVYTKVRNDQRAQKEIVQELGQTLQQAWDNDDNVLANRVFARAMALGLDTSSVLRSAQAREKRADETQLQFTASPEDEEAYGFMFNGEQ